MDEAEYKQLFRTPGVLERTARFLLIVALANGLLLLLSPLGVFLFKKTGALIGPTTEIVLPVTHLAATPVLFGLSLLLQWSNRRYEKQLNIIVALLISGVLLIWLLLGALGAMIFKEIEVVFWVFVMLYFIIFGG